MTSTAFQAGVNLAKISVGTGILALPFSTINSGGLIISPILNAGIAVLNGMYCDQSAYSCFVFCPITYLQYVSFAVLSLVAHHELKAMISRC